jgi:ribonuclease VapC
MIFADASALIAIIAGEPEADSFADLLEAEPQRLCSPISAWETIAGLCHSYTFSVPAAGAYVQGFLDALEFKWVSIGEREYHLALDANAQYGKGRHRPSSTWETASPTPVPRAMGPSFCSRAMISPKQTSLA